jgi:sodium-dependent dicarboxylate transporter 2/3/5
MLRIIQLKPGKIRDLMLFVAPVISLLIILFADFDPENRKITTTFAIAVLMAIWWITEAVPLAVTALIPVVLFPLFGIVDGKAVSALYFNHVIFLFIGGFLMAFAMERWNLHRRIALRILILFGVSPGRILMGFMLATTILSMWMSNTATAMMMVPIAFSIILKLEESLGKVNTEKYAVGLLLAVAYSASIGGIATLVGTPPNLSLVRISSIIFPKMPEISFGDWFIFALPVTVLLFLAAWLLLYLMYKPKEGWKNITIDEFRNEYKLLGKTSFEEKIVSVLFGLLIFLWIFRTEIDIQSVRIPGWESLFKNPSYINDGTVAVFFSLLLFMIPSKTQKGEKLMNWETAHKIPWGIVLLFGGGFALAQGFVDSGLSVWFGEKLASLGSVEPMVLTFANVTLISFLTELTSNVATTEMILPVAAGLAMVIKLNPLLLMIPATLAASMAFMLPVATPPNAIIFGTNKIRVIDMVKTGIILNLLSIIIITLVMYFWGTAVFGIDVTVFPDWAVAAK